MCPRSRRTTCTPLSRRSGPGPVEMFASSGGAMTALALVAAYPDDVTTLVAHEPPLIPVLPDAAAPERARAGVRDAYEAKGSGAGMAAFIAMTSWQGEFTDEYFAQPAADPALFAMPTEDDGSRDDPLRSDRSRAVSSYRPDVDALGAAPTRVVIAVGEESLNTFTGRTAVATAELLGQQATVFPSHHGGFLGGEFGYAGHPRRSRANYATSSTTTTDPPHLASQERERTTSSPSLQRPSCAVSATGRHASRSPRLGPKFSTSKRAYRAASNSALAATKRRSAPVDPVRPG